MLTQLLVTQHADALRQYIENDGGLAIAVLDAQLVILEANKRFISLFSRDGNIKGSKLDAFLPTGPNTILAMTPGQSTPVPLWLSEQENAMPLDGRVFRSGDHYVVFVETSRANDEMIAEMSALAGQLTDLNRSLQKKRAELERVNEVTLKLANTDPLTGLSNRRSFLEMLDMWFSAAVRHKHPLSVIIADLDHFKSVNDTCGHEAGDEVLISFGRILQTAGRKEDVPARIGGEEFVVLLPMNSVKRAAVLAERLRRECEQIIHPKVSWPVTSSFGVAGLREDDTPEQLLRRADEALYKAKHAGRNRVSIAE